MTGTTGFLKRQEEEQSIRIVRKWDEGGTTIMIGVFMKVLSETSGKRKTTNLLGELFRVYPITVLGVLEWTVLRSKRIEPIVFGTFWSADCAGRKNQWHMDFCE